MNANQNPISIPDPDGADGAVVDLSAAAPALFGGAAKVFSDAAPLFSDAAPVFPSGTTPAASGLAVGDEAEAEPAPVPPKPAQLSALEILQARVDALNQVVVDLPALISRHDRELKDDLARQLDCQLQAAVADTILNNGALLAQALAPHAGTILRKGVAQTGVAVVMALPTLMVWGWDKLTKKAPAVPAAPVAAAAAAAQA